MNDEPEGMAKLLADIDSGEFARRLGHELWLEKVRDAEISGENITIGGYWDEDIPDYLFYPTMRPEGPHGRNTSLGTDPPTP